MKIKKLHIYNIASIVDATIDFTAEPLSGSDVFLITGDTGAGKTTILDAICLALFNNTPRLDKEEGKSVKTDNDTLTLKDTRRLMRRNTGESFVELSFEAGGTQYEVEWHVQRGKNKKPAVSLNSNVVSRKFTNLSTNQCVTGVGTKDKELQESIQQVIGLDFNQFTRTTMLAQNDFTKFLASSEEDRAAILEKITKTSEFSAAGAKIFGIKSEKETAWKDAQKAASDTGLSDEDIAMKEENRQSLELQAEQKKAERDSADKKRDWLTREKELAETEKQAENNYKEANKLIEGEDYKRKCLFVEQWNTTIEARQWLRDKSDAEKSIANQKQHLSEQHDAFLTVLNGQLFNHLALVELKSEITKINKYLEDNALKSSTFNNAQTISAYLDTIIEKSKKAEQLLHTISENAEKRAGKLIPEREEAERLFKDAEQAKQALADQIKQKDETLSAMNLSGLRTERETLKDLLRDIEVAISDVTAIDIAANEREQESKRLAGVNESIENREKDLNEMLIPAYQEAKSKMYAAEQARDILKNSVDKFAKQMRTHLTIGCECPVCRQKVASLPIESEIDHLYVEANTNFEKARDLFKEAQEAKNKAEAGIKTDRERYVEDKAKLDDDKSVEEARAKAAASCLKCGVATINEETLTVLDKLKQEKQVSLNKVLDPKILAGETMEKELRELRNNQTRLEISYKERNEAYQATAKQVADSEAMERTNKEVVSGYQNEVQQARDNVSPLIIDADWQNDWTAEPELFKAELMLAAKTYTENKDRKGRVEIEVGPKQYSYESINGIIAEIRQIQNDWADLAPVEAKEMSNLFTAANDVLQEVTSIHGIIGQVKVNLAENIEKLTAFFAEHSNLSEERLRELDRTKTIQSLSEELETMRQEPAKKKTLWDNAIEAHQSHQTSKPELAEDDTVEKCDKVFREADNNMTLLRNAAAVIKKELEDDVSKKKGVNALQQKVDDARKEYEKWNRLCSLIGDKEGRTFRTIAQSFIFDGLLSSANVYLQKLEPRYTLKAVEGTLYSSLEDGYQGFASRDTGSLSGGESFLVSLALALALSDIGQGLSVDTLFIDEGFGSLSGRPLTNAINTLRSLRGKNGRHVGIISHIQEVRENIPVQIQVNKTANNSCSTVSVAVVNQ